MKRALYAGSFDPFTNGHLDIVKRAADIVDELVILIASSPIKSELLSIKERKELISQVVQDLGNVTVEHYHGLVTEYAKENNVTILVRGLRPTGDFENEFQMASMNRKLYKGIDTIFLPTSTDNYFVSSSLVKEVITHGGDISQFVPAIIAKALKKAQGEVK